MKGEWIRKPKAETTVVFVHGILSSGATCWKHDNGSYWPELLKNENGLEEVGIYVFTYQSNLSSGKYSIGDAVDMLREFLGFKDFSKTRRLIFVCHSMGGIVVRRFIVQQIIDLIEKGVEIGLFLVASPSLGSDYANWLSYIAEFLGHTQANALKFKDDNIWLNDLDKDFKNLLWGQKIKIEGKELIEDKFIVLKRFIGKQLVQPFSGARYFPRQLNIPGSDHFSIAKPANKDELQHVILCEFIQEMLARPLSVGQIPSTIKDDNNAPAKQLLPPQSQPVTPNVEKVSSGQITETQHALLKEIAAGKKLFDLENTGQEIESFQLIAEELQELETLNYLNKVTTHYESHTGNRHADLVMVGSITALGRRVAGNNNATEYPNLSPQSTEIFQAPKSLPETDKPLVFISYHEADKEYYEGFKKMLKLSENKGHFKLFSPENVQAGGKWKDQLEVNLRKATFAVILISADYLGSESKRAKMLHELLAKAKGENKYIIPIFVGTIPDDEYEPWEEFESICDPQKPLELLSKVECGKVYVKLANTIKKILDEEKK